LIDFPLATERLLIRPMEPGDETEFHAIWSHPGVLAAVGHHGPWPRRATHDRLAQKIAHQERHGFAAWTLCERATGKLVGECGLQYLEGGPQIEIGWRVDPALQGRGYASEAAARVLATGLGELGMERIVAVIDPANASSLRVAEKVGMTAAGRGRHYGADLLVYAAGGSGSRGTAGTEPSAENESGSREPGSTITPSSGSPTQQA
jgi:ribosomal-protein-alanine N-acetyltransferase